MATSTFTASDNKRHITAQHNLTSSWSLNAFLFFQSYTPIPYKVPYILMRAINQSRMLSTLALLAFDHSCKFALRDMLQKMPHHGSDLSRRPLPLLFPPCIVLFRSFFKRDYKKGKQIVNGNPKSRVKSLFLFSSLHLLGLHFFFPGTNSDIP